MFDAAIKALTQMFSPPFRRVLLKSIGLGLILIVLIGIGLTGVFSWMATSGAAWARASTGGAHALANPRLGAVDRRNARHHHRRPVPDAGGDRLRLLFFVDEIAEEVERTNYPMEPPGTALPLFRALIEGINTARLAVYGLSRARCRLLFAGLGLVIMFLANAYLLSREYFLFAAMRFRPPEEARAMRRAIAVRFFLPAC